jgi:hypothetical protein|tara:strand:+ start:756 stop:965 length:210 start_codon:yes stop_codon:yes gene_type:complete
MKTRSQTAKQLLDVNIDFDEASHYWNANKKRTGNGCYKYVCGKLLKNGKFCKKNINNNQINCALHINLE